MYTTSADDRSLLRRARELDSALEHGASTRQQIELLEDVMDSARSHFLLEERLMKQSRYPEFKRHVQAHDSIRQKIVELLLAARGSGQPVSQVIPALAAMISVHVSGPDAQLYAFLAQAGPLIS